MKRSFLLLCVVTCILMLFNSCKDENNGRNKSEYGPYILGYTQGLIRSSDPIFVRLDTSVLRPENSLPDLAEKILQISPQVKGTFQLDGNTLEFHPTERLKNGRIYGITLHLSKLCDVPSKLKNFRFNVKVIPQSYSFNEGYLSLETGDNNKFIYQGSITNADLTTPEQIEKLVKAAIGNTTLPLEWEHSPYVHKFIISNLNRLNEPQILALTFDQEVTNGITREIEIPDNKTFSVLEIKVANDDSRSIDIIMSDNVNVTQDLQGLVSITGIKHLNYNVQGNIIRIYPDVNDKIEGTVEVNVYKGIRTALDDKKLLVDITEQVSFPSAKPQVNFIGRGTITPGNNNALIPFSAVGLKAVQLQVVKVFNQNMNFYLQESSYKDTYDYQLRRVGRMILSKKISLEQPGKTIEPNRWYDYTINLADHVELEKGVVYRVQLKFKKSYTLLACAHSENNDLQEEYGDEELLNDYYDGGGYYFRYPDDYNWEERDDPCSNSYYYGYERFPEKNIIITSLGLTAKVGSDDKYVVSVNNLQTTEAVNNCKLTFYNYQNGKIDSAFTNSEGIAIVKLKSKAFTILAEKGEDKAYLKVLDANSLSYSNFDVGGEVVQKGLKGFLYGERGVWRPGDNIYLSFILEDSEHTIPEGHPIIAELYDPKGSVAQVEKAFRNPHGLYCFQFNTDKDALTGYWRAVVKIGGTSFSKTIRVESIKPNRLNIATTLPGNLLGKGIPYTTISFKTRWLHGAPTSSLKTDTEIKLSRGKTTFEGYPGYIFDDLSRYFSTGTTLLYEGNTDANGNFSIPVAKITAENAPGILNAVLTTRVFENSGDFSIVSNTFRYSPYTQYVGIKLPESEDNWYTTGKPISIRGALVKADGQAATSNEIEIDVYRLDWRWWWDSESDNIGSYVNRSYNRPVFHQKLKNVNGTFTIPVTCNEEGRYYVIARDKKSGHSAGSIFYVSSWDNEINVLGMATLLTLSSDKKEYRAGEKIKVQFPSSAGSVALVSIENGKTVKDFVRVPTEKGQTTFELTATSDMCPNIYVSVSLIQPHQNRDNDKPIRLYGVLNLKIEDPSLHLTPRIDMPEELHPSRDFTVTLSEKEGKPMTYTIAVVDEGLLSLTSFKTPNPFSAFYAREALGVKTWDFYDDVCGAFGGRLDKAFAVGGGETLVPEENRKSNRFTPVVIFKGPFTLKAGEKQSHTFRMPEYVGQVRTMVIAEDQGKYGCASKDTKVTSPLMLNVTMPRLFTPGDEIEIPVTLFAMKESVRDVRVNIQTDNKIELLSSARQEIRFSGIGEQLVYFKVKIKDIVGKSTLTFMAESGKEEAYYSCDVEIRVPNPRITRVTARELKAGESFTFRNNVEGVDPAASIEVSSIPSLNLEKRLKDLITYPHGCAEQITSAAFPQLMLNRLTDLTTAQKVTAELHVKDVISRLRNYQLSNGGFSYWANMSDASDWVSSYITDFLINAEQQGYHIPTTMMSAAVNYLIQKSNAWRPGDYYSEIEQSYRLYVLAEAGKTNLPAMNRMKEIVCKNPIARWQLAGAYALNKHEQTALDLVAGLPTEAGQYRQLGRCYGSDLRDNAIILQCMVNMNKREEAYKLLQKIATRFASDEWLSTQECAFGLRAVGNYVQKYFNEGTDIDVTIDQENVKTGKTIVQKELTVKNQKSTVTVRNNTNATLHARTITSSIPFGVIKRSESSGLQLEIAYYRDEHPFSGTQFMQGEDIRVQISVRNTGHIGRYDELALTCLFPSGFEFINERLLSGTNPFPKADNADLRDDRAYIYFSLNQGETKIFTLRFNAAYLGSYLLPAITCSAMYDNSITATLPGERITINRKK